MQIVYRDQAADDLADIWDYTAEVWSVDQADQYVDEIRHIISQAANAPEQVRPWPTKQSKIKRLRARHHYVFGKVEEDDFIIQRILHKNMDFLAHLGLG